MISKEAQNKKITFIAASKFHVIMSYILRYSFPEEYKKCIVISDTMDDGEVIFENIKTLSNWDDAIFIKGEKLRGVNKGNYFKKLIRIINFKFEIEKLIKDRNIRKICFFTHGDDCSNIFSSSKYPQEIYLGEDGTFPYYGGIEMYDSFKNLNLMMQTTISSVYKVNSIFKYLIKRLFFNFLIVDYRNRVQKVILLRPDLYNNNNDSIKRDILKSTYDRKIIANSFDELSKIFNYRKSDIYNNVDVVYFDSAMVRPDVCGLEEQVKFTLHLLSFFKDKNILIKLSPRANPAKYNYYKMLSKESKNIFIDDLNGKIPWEIIFYNNSDLLKNVIVSSQRSTACYSSYLLFDVESDVVLFSKLILEKFNMSEEEKKDTHLYLNFVENICKGYKQKSIYIPSKLSELNLSN